ncbi:MAG: flagellar assembly protein T N-terminal domain-containing protein [Gammaproteobacteria bacterium]
MIKRSSFLTFLCLFFLCTQIAEASKKDIEIVTATGRAAIISGEHIDDTRARALEDALYSAALLGGAEIDGFSSVQAGTQLDDHFVVRPSSKIVDYDVVDEQIDDLHYTVTIEAAVGELKKVDCQNRLLNNVTMFAPMFRVDETIPAWLSQQPAGLIKDLYEQLKRKSNFELVNRSDLRLDPKELTRDQNFSYKALTSGAIRVADGDFAVSTTITLKRVAKNTSFQQEHFAEVTIESTIFVDSDYRLTQMINHQLQVPIRKILPTRFMSDLASPNQAKIRQELSRIMSEHAAELSSAIVCTPLSATMVSKEDGMHIPIGSRQGLQENRLAFVSNKAVPWTVLRVVKTNTNSAVLKPLNRQRSPAQLSGQRVLFLEFN